MQKSKAHTLTGIILLIAAVLILLRSSFGPPTEDASDASTERHTRVDLRHEPIAVGPLTPERIRKSADIVWEVGRPSAVKPVIRGKNMARRYGSPVERELPEFIEGSTPSALAMTPADGRLELLAEETDVHTLKSRRMVFDPAALDRVIAGETNHILAPTPGSEVLDIKIERIRTRSSQTHTLIGKIAGEQTSEVQLVYHDGIIHGTVSRYSENQYFEYRMLVDNHMMVRELDTANMNDVCGNLDEDLAAADIVDPAHTCGPGCAHADLTTTTATEPAPGKEPEVAEATAGWTTIDIVVGYGALARTNQGGVSAMEAHIIAAVERMNGALLNSAVTDTEVMLLGTIEDPGYSFPGNDPNDMGAADELGDLGDISDGSLDTVTDYAATLGSDLVCFVMDAAQNLVAGVANRPGRYSIVSRTNMNATALTFCHELGHNFGARHSYGDGGDTVVSKRYGVRFEGADDGLRYRTVMAYNNSPDFTATRIPYFSNPAVSYQGTPTGLADGANLAASNTYYDPVYEAGYSGNINLAARNADMFLVAEGENGTAFASNRAIRKALAVTSPLAGVLWPAGSTQTISFLGGDMDYTADIDLYKGGVYQTTLANDIAAIDHSFEWTIPAGQQGDNDYQIRITLTHTTTAATSQVDSDFFVIQNNDGIILESPIGGENWTRSTVQNITWSSIYTGNVSIEYIKGASAPVTIIASTPDDGSYAWTIPDNLTLGSDYIIRITSDVSPFDSSESAGNFNITAPSSLIYSNNLDTDPGFTTTGSFEYGAPGGINGASTAFSGTNMYDTDLDGTADSNATLTTTAIDCSNHANVNLEFYAHYVLVGGFSDGWTAVVEVSNDNSTWTEVYSQKGIQTNAWNKYSYDISSVADGSSTVYIRWSMLGSGNNFTGGGIAIDDITVTGNFVPSDGFNLLKPNGGQTLTTTAAYTISWLSNLAGNAKIELLKNGAVHSTIAASTPNDGSYYWLVPDTLPAASDYKIRISSVVDGAKLDESDSNFSIAAPSNIIFSSNLDSDPGFTRTGSFDYGTLGGNNLPPSSHTGSNAYDTEIDDPSSGNTGFGSGTLVSTPLDCSNYQNINLQFWSFIYISPNYRISFQVSTDNSTWQTLETISDVQNTGWVERNYDISTYAATQPIVYIRWNYENHTGYPGQYTGGGVAIDDITITGDFVPSLHTYESWSSSTSSTNDPNGDGIKNALAWVLGAASPSANALPLLPTFGETTDPDIMTFNYRRSDAANADANTTITVEYSGDLSTWTTAVDNDTTVNIFEDDDFYGAGVDRVRVELNRSLGPDGKLFSRLGATVSE